MRTAELRRMTWRDVDFSDMLIRVGRKEAPNRIHRYVPIAPTLAPLLAAMRRMATDDGEFVLAVFAGHRIGPARAGVHFTRHCLAAGIMRSGLSLRALRDTGIMWHSLQGPSPVLIMTRMGDSDLRDANAYVIRARELREELGRPFPELPACLIQAAGAQNFSTTAKEGDST